MLGKSRSEEQGAEVGSAVHSAVSHKLCYIMDAESTYHDATWWFTSKYVRIRGAKEESHLLSSWHGWSRYVLVFCIKWGTYTQQTNSATEKSKVMSFAGKWMLLEIILKSVGLTIQSEREVSLVLSFVGPSLYRIL